MAGIKATIALEHSTANITSLSTWDRAIIQHLSALRKLDYSTKNAPSGRWKDQKESGNVETAPPMEDDLLVMIAMGQETVSSQMAALTNTVEAKLERLENKVNDLATERSKEKQSTNRPRIPQGVAIVLKDCQASNLRAGDCDELEVPYHNCGNTSAERVVLRGNYTTGAYTIKSLLGGARLIAKPSGKLVLGYNHEEYDEGCDVDCSEFYLDPVSKNCAFRLVPTTSGNPICSKDGDCFCSEEMSPATEFTIAWRGDQQSISGKKLTHKTTIPTGVEIVLQGAHGKTLFCCDGDTACGSNVNRAEWEKMICLALDDGSFLIQSTKEGGYLRTLANDKVVFGGYEQKFLIETNEEDDGLYIKSVDTECYVRSLPDGEVQCDSTGPTNDAKWHVVWRGDYLL